MSRHTPGMRVAKIIQASLGATEQSLDRGGSNPRTRAILNQMRKQAPKPAPKPTPKHVEIHIKLLVPH